MADKKKSELISDLAGFERMPIDSIVPYDANPRQHDEDQVNALVRSYREFGFNSHVLIDEANVLLAGHGRLLAAKKAGMKEIWTARRTGLTDAQKKAYRIADNRIALSATWNPDVLIAQIEDLDEVNFDTTLTGFTQGELNKLLGTAQPKQQEEIGGGRLLLMVECDNEPTLQELFEELSKRQDLKCKLLN